MLRLTFRNLLARKLRMVTTGLAVLIGVAFMSGGVVLTDTIGAAFDDLFTLAAEGTDAVVRSANTVDSGFGDARGRIDESLLEEAAAVEGVRAVVAQAGFGIAELVDADGRSVGDPPPPTLPNIWIDDTDLNAFHVVEGRSPSGDGEIVLDRRTAEDEEVEIGHRLTMLGLEGPVEVSVVGLTEFRDDGAGGPGNVGMTLRLAQRQLGEAGKVDAIAVAAEDGISQDEIVERLRRAMPEGVEVVTGRTVVEETRELAQQGLGFLRTIINVFAGIALFVGVFIIYNTFSILVAQRTREMALLRAVGASRRQVLLSLLLEALVIGVVSSLLGLGAGIALAGLLIALLSAFGFDLPGHGFLVTGGTALLAMSVGVTVTSVAAVFPARRGATVPPVAAMREVAFERPERSRARLALGGVVTALGAAGVLGGVFADGRLELVIAGAVFTFLGTAALGPLFVRPIVGLMGAPLPRLLGVTGNLARENAIRNPRRTSRTAAALLIGVALVSMITILASSVRASFEQVFAEQFTGDFVVDGGGFGFGGGPGGVSPKLAEALRDRPELGAVAAVRRAPARVGGEDGFLTAIHPDGPAEIFDIGLLEGDYDDLDDGGVAVHVDRARDEGWDIGTRVPVEFLDGSTVELAVAVVYDKREVAGPLFVGTDVFDRHVPTSLDQQLFVNKADQASHGEALAVIEEEAAPYPSVEVDDREGFIERQAEVFDIVLTVIYALLGLAVVIALLGIMNTLFLSIVERTRELGLLRAVGMSRKQMRSSVRWEALLVAVFGTLGGLLVGSFFGWSLVQALQDEGFEVFEYPTVRLVVIAVIGAVAGVLAALLPARRAARLDLLRAIAAE